MFRRSCNTILKISQKNTIRATVYMQHCDFHKVYVLPKIPQKEKKMKSIPEQYSNTRPLF